MALGFCYKSPSSPKRSHGSSGQHHSRIENANDAGWAFRENEGRKCKKERCLFSNEGLGNGRVSANQALISKSQTTFKTTSSEAPLYPVSPSQVPIFNSPKVIKNLKLQDLLRLSWWRSRKVLKAIGVASIETTSLAVTGNPMVTMWWLGVYQ